MTGAEIGLLIGVLLGGLVGFFTGAVIVASWFDEKKRK